MSKEPQLPEALSLPAAFEASSINCPNVPISWGELVDKITILEIKAARLQSAESLQNVRRELDLLSGLMQQLQSPPARLSGLKIALQIVNERLWDTENEIRSKEARGEFDAEFIELARAVYTTNDERARLKREINLLLKSALIEEKQYTEYCVAQIQRA
jgi:hypothetical protein